MRLRIFACALPVLAALGAPAGAQIAPDVTVNPQATGSRVLLYPDGSHTRLVHPLLQPGQVDPNAPIHLHMPTRHRSEHHHVARTKPKTETASRPAPQRSAAQQPAPAYSDPFGAFPNTAVTNTMAPAKLPPAPAKTAVRKPTPPPAKTRAEAEDDGGMSFLSGQNPSKLSLPSTPASGTTATNRPVQVAQPARTASLSANDQAGRDLSKRSSIPFAAGAEEPAPSVLDTVRAMSDGLNAALSNGSSRIQLEAYGGKRDDKSSDARRLSLKRALIIRQLLIDDGVPSERIDVRAMGGASDGAPDRVDVYVSG